MSTTSLGWLAANRPDMLAHLVMYPVRTVALAHDVSVDYARQVARALRQSGVDTYAERKARGEALPTGGLVLRDKPGQDEGGADPGAV